MIDNLEPFRLAVESATTISSRHKIVQDLAEQISRAGQHIGGRFVAANGTDILSIWDPSTGSRLATYAAADDGDVDHAVRVAFDAQKIWAQTTVRERAERLLALSSALRKHARLLGLCDSVNAGIPLAAAEAEAEAAADNIALHAGYGHLPTGEVFERGNARHLFTSSEPFGVVGRIVAHNHPTYATVTALLPALLAGNAIVLKPADQTPLTALLVAQIAAEFFPAGLFNVVCGGVAAGAALVTHPLVRRIAFTGSTETGLRIQRSAASMVRTVTLELSGKNAMLVLPDADLDEVADGVVAGMNVRVTQGQSCASTSRIYVPNSLRDDLVDRIMYRMSHLRTGIAYDDAMDLGPVVSQEHAADIRGFVERAVRNGARAHSVEATAQWPSGGFYVPFTILTQLEQSSEAAREEVFGPVVSVLGWDDEADIIPLANDSAYGLSASIWTSDIDRALSLAARVEAGYVWVNCAGEFPTGLPFGGWNDSGIGVQEGLAEIQSYRRRKSVQVRVHTA